jgi:hypothetical protein
MFIRRAVLLVAALLVAGTTMASAASAGVPPAGDDDYTTLCSKLTVEPAAPAPGTDVTVSGDAASPNADIVFVLNGDVIGNTTSGADRHFSGTAHIPADATDGTIQAVQVGDDTDPVVGCPAQVAGVTITRTVPVEPGALPATGANSTLPLTRIGLGLVAAGGLLVLATQRRRSMLAA